jgi:3D (Asp-Asp-Asp) domain-containing protein
MNKMQSMRMAILRVALLTITRVAFADPPDQSENLLVSTFQLKRPDALSSPVMLWATHYYVYFAKERADGVPLLDDLRRPISGRLDPKDWCLGAIEGTIRAESSTGGATFNFSKASGTPQVDCAKILNINPRKKRYIKDTGRSLFTLARGPFGDGVENFVLVPYRTIAVDPKIIPIGTVVYIPSARGLQFKSPAGQALVHDGYFFAADIGGGISGNHIDVFCGTTSRNCLPSLIKGSGREKFQAYVYEAPAIAEALRELHSLR